MDLSQYKVSTEPVFLQFTHPLTGLPMEDENGPVGVHIVGQDSPSYKARQRKLIDDNMARLRAIKAGKDSPKALTGIGESLDVNRLETIAACVHSIDNISLDGEALSAPKDTKRMLVELPWSADQIDSAIVDRSRFMKALPNDSENSAGPSSGDTQTE